MSAPGPLVLVVEDEPQMRRFLRASLTSHGYDLCEAATPAEAVALATSRRRSWCCWTWGCPTRTGSPDPPAARVVARPDHRHLGARARGGQGRRARRRRRRLPDQAVRRRRAAGPHARRAPPRAAGGGRRAPIIEIGPLRIDLARREVKRDGVELHLTPIEYRCSPCSRRTPAAC